MYSKDWVLNEIKVQNNARNIDLSSELWVDNFYPRTEKDLGVHKDKFKELFSLIKECLGQKKNIGGPIILITGPPGSGKTSTVKVIANILDTNLMEWEDQSFGLNELTDLEQFVKAAGLYGNIIKNNKIEQTGIDTFNKSSILLLENLPVSVTEHPSRFHQILRLHFKHAQPNCLLVIILSSSTSARLDIFSEKVLCPPNLCNELNIKRLEFNPVAPSLVTKALSRIVNCVNSQFGIQTPSRQLLQTIASECSGDLRSATNQLQFLLCKCGPKSTNPTTNRRDANLSLFRTIGKILYGKRQSTEKDELDPIYSMMQSKQNIKCKIKEVKTIDLPSHLKMWQGLPPLTFNVEEVLDLSQGDGDNILSWLHENYLDFAPHLNALKWVFDQFSWTDAYLTGGMNWRLGLTPGADWNCTGNISKNSSRFHKPNYANASHHYPALVVSRTILLANQMKIEDDSVTGFHNNSVRTFRPLRSPYLLNVWKVSADRIDYLSNLIMIKNSLCPTWLAHQMVDGRRNLMMDLPMFIKILGENWFSHIVSDVELLVNLCKFSQPGLSQNNHLNRTSKSYTSSTFSNQHTNLNNIESDESLCPPDARAEGNALFIDEHFSDEENEFNT